LDVWHFRNVNAIFGGIQGTNHAELSVEHGVTALKIIKVCEISGSHGGE
jgi:hypothetical protein